MKKVFDSRYAHFFYFCFQTDYQCDEEIREKNSVTDEYLLSISLGSIPSYLSLASLLLDLTDFI